MPRVRKHKDAPAPKPTPAAPTWQAGDRVTVDFDGDDYDGTIKMILLKQQVAVVTFDDGEEHRIDLTKLRKAKSRPPAELDNGDDSTEDDGEGEVEASDNQVVFHPPRPGQRGMHHYPIAWDKDGIHFALHAAPDEDDVAISERGDDLAKRLRGRSVKFTGFWRKTKFYTTNDNGKSTGKEAGAGWSIDMYAKVPHEVGDGYDEYLVESIPYLEGAPDDKGKPQGDPRLNMHLLNSDICAAVRKWFFLEAKGDRETVRQLRKRADHPILRAPSLAWLDQFILKAKEIRDVGLRSGGERMIVLDTGKKGDPVVAIQFNFTGIALVTEGKVPSLTAGTMVENTVKSGGKKSAGRQEGLTLKMDAGNAKELGAKLAELNAKAKGGDESAKKEAKKLRAAMRRMGHTGGARSIE